MYKSEDFPEIPIQTNLVKYPPKNSLVFNLNANFLEFNSTPQTTKVVLENNDVSKYEFFIQCSHPQFYTFDPCFGIIDSLDKREILITFKHNFNEPKGRVKGYMYVRTKHGFPLQRYYLDKLDYPCQHSIFLPLKFLMIH